MFRTPEALLHSSLALLLLRALSPVAADTTNVGDILRRAAGDFASSVGTSLDTGRLNGGICLSSTYGVPSNSAVACTSLPNNFVYLTYSTPTLGITKITAPSMASNAGSQSQGCGPYPFAGSCTPTLTLMQQNSISYSTSTSFAATDTLTVSAALDGVGVEGSKALTFTTESTSGTTNVTGSSGAVSGPVTVPANTCIRVYLNSTLYKTQQSTSWSVTVSGGIAVWFKDSVNIPGGSGNHYNWNVDVATLIKLAQKGGYAGGLVAQSSGGATFTDATTLTLYKYDGNIYSTIVSCPTGRRMKSLV